MSSDAARRRDYRFGKCALSLIFGSITDSEAEVIVSSDDHLLTMGGGVSAAISRAGGEAIMIDAAKKVPARVGDIVVTTAGDLPARFVFHAITIGPEGPAQDAPVVIESVVQKSFSLLDSLGLTTIAFPAVGAGVARYGYPEVAALMAEEIVKVFRESQRSLSASVYLFDRYGRMGPMDFVEFFEEFHARSFSFDDQPMAAERPSAEQPGNDKARRTDSPRSERQEQLKELSRLSQRRDDLEATLARLAGGLEAEERGRIEQELSEIRQRRLEILKAVHEPGVQQLDAFISYAHEDGEIVLRLKNHLRALEHQGLVRVWSDRRIRAGSHWESEIDDRLSNADLVLVLVSADFLASDYCMGVEMTKALERHAAGQCLVIPVVARPVLWDRLPISRLQALPKDGKAIEDWPSADSACVDIARGVRIAIEEFFEKD